MPPPQEPTTFGVSAFSKNAVGELFAFGLHRGAKIPNAEIA
jgi:hypothetical protein